MNGQGKSDGLIVPGKLLNKGGERTESGHGAPYTGTKVETPETAKGAPKASTTEGKPTAERVEGRRPAKGNSPKRDRRRTQMRNNMPGLQSALERVREVAVSEPRLIVNTTRGRSPVR